MLALAVLILAVGYTFAYAGMRPGKGDKYAKAPWKLWTEAAPVTVRDGKLALAGKYAQLAAEQKQRAQTSKPSEQQGFIAGTIVPLPPGLGGSPQIPPFAVPSNPLLAPPFGPGSGSPQQIPNPFKSSTLGPV